MTFRPAGAETAVTDTLSEDARRALEVLAQNGEFRHISHEHLAEFARQGRRQLFAGGAVLMRQGAESDCLHILVKGEVKVERDDGAGHSFVLAELQPGDIVGEMGVLHGDPRTATVTAVSEVETLELSASFLHDIFQREPDVLMAICRVINERLKSVDAVVENTLKMAMAHLGGPSEPD